MYRSRVSPSATAMIAQHQPRQMDRTSRRERAGAEPHDNPRPPVAASASAASRADSPPLSIASARERPKCPLHQRSWNSENPTAVNQKIRSRYM